MLSIQYRRTDGHARNYALTSTPSPRLQFASMHRGKSVSQNTQRTHTPWMTGIARPQLFYAFVLRFVILFGRGDLEGDNATAHIVATFLDTWPRSSHDAALIGFIVLGDCALSFFSLCRTGLSPKELRGWCAGDLTGMNPPSGLPAPGRPRSGSTPPYYGGDCFLFWIDRAFKALGPRAFWHLDAVTIGSVL
jgi:hypothetical protein